MSLLERTAQPKSFSALLSWLNEHVVHVTLARTGHAVGHTYYLRYGIPTFFWALTHSKPRRAGKGYVGFGQRHRVGGPAVVRPKGSYEYWERGERHREGGPAIRYTGEVGYEFREDYVVRGRHHRDDGPSTTWFFHARMEHAWCLYGVPLTKTEWLCEVLEKRVANESEAQALTALAPTWDGTPDELLATIRILEGDAVAVHESTK